MTKFYTFDQNSSGGSFRIEKKRGITEFVIVEAESASHANERAEEIGLYFNGVDEDIDCPCCGDRWYRKRQGDGTEKLKVYGYALGATSSKKDAMVSVHFLDGSKKFYDYPGRF